MNDFALFPPSVERDCGEASGVSGDPGAEGVCCRPGPSIVWCSQGLQGEQEVQGCCES